MENEILIEIAILKTQMATVFEGLNHMTEFHMRILYICLPVAIAGIYIVLKSKSKD